MRRPDAATTRAIVLALGTATAGAMAGIGFARGRAVDRFVTVKGISEREVRADLALWPLRLVVADNDLSLAYRRLDAQLRLIRAFLGRYGVDTTGTELQDFSVSDAFTNQFRDPQTVGSRYVIQQTLMVRSEDPERVLTASQRVGELVQAGVLFSSGEEYGTGGPTFVFSSLVALMRSAAPPPRGLLEQPGAYVRLVRSVLRETARLEVLGVTEPNDIVGWGLVDPHAAVQKMQAAIGALK